MLFSLGFVRTARLLSHQTQKFTLKDICPMCIIIGCTSNSAMGAYFLKGKNNFALILLPFLLARVPDLTLLCDSFFITSCYYYITMVLKQYRYN